MGDTYVGGMSLPGVMGLKVSRPMASLMVTADELTFTAIAPLSWLIRPRHIARSDVLAVRATAAGFGVSGVDVHTQSHDVFTFWTHEATAVSGRLAELGYPVRAPL
ncbi:MAG: hypothetical protein U0R76_06805 [Candidatus Nanopelagicales bacterium]